MKGRARSGPRGGETGLSAALLADCLVLETAVLPGCWPVGSVGENGELYVTDAQNKCAT